MERQIADLSDVSLALADPSSAAGSDHDAPYRRPGEGATPFRRPPASMHVPGNPAAGAPRARRRTAGSNADTGSWNAFAAGETAEQARVRDDVQDRHPAAGPAWNAHDASEEPGRDAVDPWEAGRLEGRARREAEDRWELERQREPRPEPPFGPAPPATNGRTGFGFTAGPISGHWRDGAPISGAPASPASSVSRAFVEPDAPAPDSDVLPPAPGAAHRLSDVGRRRPEDDHIGDLVGDSAHEIRPHRAGHPPAAPRRSPGVLVAGLGLTAAVLFGGTAAGVAYYSGAEDDGPAGVQELGVGARTADRVASAPIEGRTEASFDLVSAVTKVTLRSADLGDMLYRVTTAEDSGMLPKPVLERQGVQLNLTPEGAAVTGTGELDVTLSSRVTWSLRFSGGADERQLDLEQGKIGAISFQGGSRRTSIRLPEAAGTVPVRIDGAIDELAMTSPTGNPVRVKVNGGAQTVAAGARTLTDIEPGSTLTPKGWATDDRYDVEAKSRVTLLTVDTRK